jgi:hypothetical protein
MTAATALPPFPALVLAIAGSQQRGYFNQGFKVSVEGVQFGLLFLQGLDEYAQWASSSSF